MTQLLLFDDPTTDAPANAEAPADAQAPADADTDRTAGFEAGVRQPCSSRDLAVAAAIADWRRRQEAGDTEPRWDRWSEFTLQTSAGRVTVVHDPTWSMGGASIYTHHLSFYGPVSETGYKSHFVHTKGGADLPLADYAQALAEAWIAEMRVPRRRRTAKARSPKFIKPEAPEGVPVKGDAESEEP